MDSKVSFTIRRPTPVSRATSSGPDSDAGSSFKVPQVPRHLATNDDHTSLGSPLARSATGSPHPAKREDVDSSDEDSTVEDELVTGFDKFGVQRCVSLGSPTMQLFQLTKVPFEYSCSVNGDRKKINKPLVIPALQNKDWRDLARKRRSAAQYVPASAKAETGKDGSVGGLGTRDTINSGPVLSGIQIKKTVIATENNDIAQESTEDVEMELVEESEDQKAIRAILAESSGELQHEGPLIDIIPTPLSEADAFKQDVDELPDVATMEDYARVPVSQFGAALLRGMGWKEGTAATRKPGKGMVEPYLPAARPALLGIGAKEQELYDDGSKKGNKSKRPDRRYVPIIKQERSGSDASTPNGTSHDQRERSRSPHRSAAPSRRSSRSPDRYSRSERSGDSSRRRDDRERERDRDRDRRRDDDRDRDRDRKREDDRSGRRDDDRDRSDRKRERSRDSSRRRRDY